MRNAPESRRSLVRILIITLLFALVLPMARAASAQPSTSATPTPVERAWTPGDTVRIQNERGNRRVDTTITTVADPTSAVKPTHRGYRVVGIEITLTNRGVSEFEIGPYQLVLIDDAGLYVWEMPSTRFGNDLPNLLPQKTLEPGETMSGWLYFELVSVAKPTGFLYLGYEYAPYVSLLARFQPGRAGGADTVMNRSAEPLGTITIEQILAPFERTDPSIEPRRGMRAVALIVSVTNTSARTWNLEDSIYLVDQYGQFYYRFRYDRSTASGRAYPELANHVRAGQTERGVFVFEVPSDSNVDLIAFIPNQEQFVVLGGAYASITVTPETYAGSAADDDWGSSTPGCEGVREWAEESWAAMKLAADTVSDMTSSSESSTPADLRSAASTLRATATVQEALVAPTVARDAHADIIALLRAAADALDDAATRIESGESPAAVLELINSPRSPFTRASVTAISSLLKVTTACPLD